MMKLFIFVYFKMLLLYVVNADGSEDTGSAFNRICDRFPWMATCHQNAEVTTVQPTNILTTTMSPGQNDFCKKYRINFSWYCSATTSDVVLEKFCLSYRGKCNAAKPFVVGLSDSTGTVQDRKRYCDNYENYYNLHCLDLDHIEPKNTKFCLGYAGKCYDSAPFSDLPNPIPGDFHQATKFIARFYDIDVEKEESHEPIGASDTKHPQLPKQN